MMDKIIGIFLALFFITMLSMAAYDIYWEAELHKALIELTKH